MLRETQNAKKYLEPHSLRKVDLCPAGFSPYHVLLGMRVRHGLFVENIRLSRKHGRGRSDIVRNCDPAGIAPSATTELRSVIAW